jgi:hypothetical protein
LLKDPVVPELPTLPFTPSAVKVYVTGAATAGSAEAQAMMARRPRITPARACRAEGRDLQVEAMVMMGFLDAVGGARYGRKGKGRQSSRYAGR